ncbi:serine hydrolase domain-containing protein [Marinobacter sp. X15-166B]|uniref:serine hydrolase domain-containing protein n=1 Tax=Marinobacter sp. X15-166B TaxID=1897620 RepID=UPI00085C9FF3|nr:serine hydrolase domain-containing protein [Marinobacter sp. X15-166B]OEY66185.1 serine hydrolase [Marinobacter sp. X15-166B]
MSQLVRRALHTSAIPQDLSRVTWCATGSENPGAVGVSEQSVAAVWRAVERLYRTGVHPGIQLSIRHRGEQILHRAIGHASGNGPDDPPDAPGTPLTTDTPFCYFSASKAVTAFLIHLLVEQGLIDLSEPIAYYCPEFAARGKHAITLHQMLAHRGGIPLLPKHTPSEVLWDAEDMWRLLCAAQPVDVEGSRVAYHALTGGFVMQRVLEQVTGGSIEAFLDTHLRQPLGMRWFTYGLPAEHLSQLPPSYATGPRPRFPVSWILRRALGGDITTIERVVNNPRFQAAVIPSGNLCGTAEEMGRFYQMLLNGGHWQGTRVCSEATVRRLIRPCGSWQIDRTTALPVRFSAGMMLGGNPLGVWGPHSGAAFGHAGLINKLCWADAARDISVTLLNSGLPIVGHHLPALVRFVYTVAREFPAVPDHRHPLAAD